MVTRRHLRSASTPFPVSGTSRSSGRVERPAVDPLWRSLVGRRLRERRTEREEKLTDTAARAGISPQYLSEVERGRKDPSSEVLAAVLGALDLTLVDLTTAVATELMRPSLSRAATSITRSGPRAGGAQLSLAA